MTQDAKWVIGCITEMRGRYGQALVIGTLLGSKRARLREIGADSYNCYGQLQSRTENDLRLLISQMIRQGYIVQTDGEYSVLKVGNISELQQKNTQILVKKFKEKEKISASKKLRQLRLQIAKEESVPPYIVFTDKTLIDMCEKLPGTESEMLDVSGVGQNKLKKYGQRFLQEISSFLSNNN